MNFRKMKPQLKGLRLIVVRTGFEPVKIGSTDLPTLLLYLHILFFSCPIASTIPPPDYLLTSQFFNYF